MRIRIFSSGVLVVLMMTGCEPRAPADGEESSGRSAGDTVEICWDEAASETCTLSVLHASGEGDFGDVALRGCRDIVMERDTLVELFCSGPGADVHEVWHLSEDDSAGE